MDHLQDDHAFNSFSFHSGKRRHAHHVSNIFIYALHITILRMPATCVTLNHPCKFMADQIFQHFCFFLMAKQKEEDGGPVRERDGRRVSATLVGPIGIVQIPIEYGLKL